MNNEEKLLSAIQLARSGELTRANELFRAIVKQDPECIPAWLWLSELAPTLEEQNAALEQAVQRIPKGNAPQRTIQDYLNELRGSRPFTLPDDQSISPAPFFTSSAAAAPSRNEHFDELYLQAQRLSMVDKREEAIRLLNELVDLNPQEARAWMLLGELQRDPETKIGMFEKVAALDPGNKEVAQCIAALRPVLVNPLQRGQYLEENGDFEGATQLYRSITVHSRLPAERVEAERRIADLHLREEASRMQPINPTLNLVRVTLGPVFLFIIMIFLQSGLNLFHTPLLAFPGLASVLAGSFMVSLTEMRPMHPRWIKRFGPPGTGDEPGVRRDVRLLGMALMLAPFTIFLVEASYRLGELQASMMNNH